MLLLMKRKLIVKVHRTIRKSKWFQFPPLWFFKVVNIWKNYITTWLVLQLKSFFHFNLLQSRFYELCRFPTKMQEYLSLISQDCWNNKSSFTSYTSCKAPVLQLVSGARLRTIWCSATVLGWSHNGLNFIYVYHVFPFSEFPEIMLKASENFEACKIRATAEAAA